jgi:hypothetical protein
VARVALVALTAVALAARAVGAQANSLAGRYTVTYAAGDAGVPSMVYGSWTLLMKPDSSYVVLSSADSVVRGRYRQPARESVEFTDRSGPYACQGDQATASYTWTVSGDQLTFHVVADRCDPRRAILTGKPFRRSQ